MGESPVVFVFIRRVHLDLYLNFSFAGMRNIFKRNYAWYASPGKVCCLIEKKVLLVKLFIDGRMCTRNSWCIANGIGKCMIMYNAVIVCLSTF